MSSDPPGAPELALISITPPSSSDLLVWSTFEPTGTGHGGNLRTTQIAEMCCAAGFSPQAVTRDGIVPAGRRLAAGLRAHLTLRRAGIRTPWRELSLTGYYACILSRKLRAHVGARVLLWEGTTSVLPAFISRQHGFSVVALPHNLESLTGKPNDAVALHAEAAALAIADRLFCITEEESWLLANLGVPADYVPYYPPAARAARLSAVAARRAGGVPANAPWLIVGTAHHAPTREGIRAVLRLLTPPSAPKVRVVVAGYGTAALATEFAGQPIEFRGEVDDSTLDTLMAGARGLLVHQERGTGALTRIPDALVTGLPVLANAVAARGTRGYPGIRVYRNAGELRSLLGDPRAHAAFAPLAPPAGAISRFSAVLHQLAGAQRANQT